MQQLSSSYTAWSLLLSIFILPQAYCSMMSCDQINPKGIILLILIIIIMVLYIYIYIIILIFCQYITGVDDETINLEVECLHNGYVTISWDDTPDKVASCQIEYLCYSDQSEQVCFYYAFTLLYQFCYLYIIYITQNQDHGYNHTYNYKDMQYYFYLSYSSYISIHIYYNAFVLVLFYFDNNDYF